MKDTKTNQRTLFIILDSFGEKCGEQRTSLLPILEASQEGPLLCSVKGYYRKDTDVALLALSFDERSINNNKRQWLTEIAGDGGMAVLDPSRLSQNDRSTFYDDYLARYPERFEDLESFEDVLDTLSSLVGYVDIDVDLEASPASGESIKAEQPPETKFDKTSRFEHSEPGLKSSMIQVRFQIGEDWQPARLRSLTTKAAILATGALPSHGRRVRIEFRLDEYRTLASGLIESIDQSKTASFRVHFDSLSTSERQGIMELLLTATRQNIELKPPPARIAPRFNIQWPAQVIVGNTLHRGVMSDISERGLFIATDENLTHTSFKFHFKHDQIDTMIAGEATVARVVDATMRNQIAIQRGYGLQLRDFEVAHNYQKFVARVEKRNRYHLVVAAVDSRAHEIGNALRSCGYSVSRLTQSDSFDQVTSQQRIPDFAIVDPSYRDIDPTTKLKALLSEIQIPTLEQSTHIEDHRRRVDEALAVV